MLLTKLYRPKIKDNLVYRQGLSEILDKARNKKLVLVSAPAGYGKTTLVSQWIEKNKLLSVWYSIDNSDNEPTVFLNYLITGIQYVKKEFGQNALKLINSPNKVNIESIVTLLINNLLALKDELFIVLDDIHLINQKEVFDAISFLLTHLPQNVHLVILTRSDPPLLTSRLRSQDELLEIRISDLSFSSNEIAVFLNNKQKLGLADSEIHSLESKTEGWIAGLQLAALSMQGIEDRTSFIEELAGSNRYIMDYLIEEVLRKQPNEIQNFLLKTSFLKQISAPLCNSILNRKDSQHVLEQLDRDNMFVIPLDTERKWYRYHHLFADLLKQKLLSEYDTEIRDLHKQASIWLEENGFYHLAVEHSIATRDYQRSLQIIEKIVENLWENGKYSAIKKYGDSIPDDLIKKNPVFCLYYSWILISAGESNKAKDFLSSAEDETKKQIFGTNSLKQNIQLVKQLLGKIYIAFALFYSQEEYLEKTAFYGNLALDNLADDDSYWLSWAWYFIANEDLAKENLEKGNEGLNTALEYSKISGNLYLMAHITVNLTFHKTVQGHYRSSFKQCTDLIDIIEKEGYSELSKVEWMFTGLYTMMSQIQCIWADFDSALENAKIAYNLSKNVKDLTQVNSFIGLYAYSYVLYWKGDRSGSIDKLSEIEDFLRDNTLFPFLNTLYVGWKIYLLIESEKLEEANKFAEGNGLGNDKRISFENEFEYIHYIRLLIANYKLKEAELVLSELYELATAGKRVETIVQLNIFSSLLSKLNGKQEEAVVQMTEAMELASEEYLLNYFLFDLDLTKDIISRVYIVQATRKTKISKTFIQRLKSAIDALENKKKIKAESNLTEREIETLELLADNLSNKEIADKLFISLNTVKTRLKNIFLKLEVDNRRKAAEKAKEKGLL